jgi:hypothetical protein
MRRRAVNNFGGEVFEGGALCLLRNRKRGSGCADKPLLLWSSAEVVQPTISSADLQFLENRKFSRAEICAAFGVPEEIVATTDYNKYDVMQGARLNFIENRVAPLCARLEAEENKTTIPALLKSFPESSIASAPPIENRKSKISSVGSTSIHFPSCSRPGATASPLPKSASIWVSLSTNSTASSTSASNHCPTAIPLICQKPFSPLQTIQLSHHAVTWRSMR